MSYLKRYSEHLPIYLTVLLIHWVWLLFNFILQINTKSYIIITKSVFDYITTVFLTCRTALDLSKSILPRSHVRKEHFSSLFAMALELVSLSRLPWQRCQVRTWVRHVRTLQFPRGNLKHFSSLWYRRDLNFPTGKGAFPTVTWEIISFLLTVSTSLTSSQVKTIPKVSAK